MLREVYMLAALNLKKKARDRQPNKMTFENSKFKVGRFRIAEKPQEATIYAKHMTNFRMCKIIHDRIYDLQNPSGHVWCLALAGIQLLMPAEYIVSLLPDKIEIWRTCRYINDPSIMPNLNWSDPDQKQREKSTRNLNEWRQAYYLQSQKIIAHKLLTLKFLNLNSFGLSAIPKFILSNETRTKCIMKAGYNTWESDCRKKENC